MNDAVVQWPATVDASDIVNLNFVVDRSRGNTPTISCASFARSCMSILAPSRSQLWTGGCQKWEERPRVAEAGVRKRLVDCERNQLPDRTQHTHIGGGGRCARTRDSHASSYRRRPGKPLQYTAPHVGGSIRCALDGKLPPRVLRRHPCGSRCGRHVCGSQEKGWADHHQRGWWVDSAALGGAACPFHV